MAEIKIEKKTPIWPWILVILIILAAIYYFWYNNDKNLDSNDDLLQRDTISQIEEPYQSDMEMTDKDVLYTGKYGTVKNEQAMADYFSFVDNLDNKATDKSYYRTAFFKLITATKRQAEIAMVDVNTNISAAMVSAEKMTNVENSTAKADNVKKAADEVSKALKTIQQKMSNDLSADVTEVEKAVSGIDASQMIDKQADNVDTFFDKTATVLHKMTEVQNNESDTNQ